MLRKKTATKVTLAVSIILIIAWILLSANASLAWLDADDSIINILNFNQNFKVELYHKTTTGYEKVDATTKVFDDAALYEPGYTQLVFLRIDNAGDIPFAYDMSVIPDLATMVIGKNAKGEDIVLPDHLKFGLVFDSTEEGLLEKTADRRLARKYATQKLSDYSENGGVLTAGASNYCALILYMPEEVANEANYRGTTVPSVEVGIGVFATQVE